MLLRLASSLLALLLCALAHADAGSRPAAASSSSDVRRDVSTIAAASDLQFALPAIATLFEAQTGRKVKLVFGSSGNLRRQIADGAPFALFLSADEQFVADLQREGRTEGAASLYAVGRLALFVPTGSPLRAGATLADLRAAVSDGRLAKLAIANPAHAPYGRAAREVLQHIGVWDRVAPRLVLGENVSQAAQFAASGSAQAGLIAYSLALAPGVAARGTAVLVPAALHAPLRQSMTLVKGAGDTARAFFAFLQAPAARAVFRRYGFLLPGE